MGAGQGVEGTERLIHQQHFRLHRQGAGNADPLLHAAGDLSRTLVDGMPHLHPIEVVFNPLPTLGLAHAAAEYLIHRERHVVEAGQPRQQGVVLEHYRPLRPRACDLAVIADQPAFAGQGDTGDEVQQRRFAAAGMADQTDGLPLVDIKRDVLQCQKLAAGRGKTLADGLDLN